MATVIIEPENLARMMASFYPAVLLQRNPIETQTSADDSVFRYSSIARSWGPSIESYIVQSSRPPALDQENIGRLAKFAP